jgi:hypothetical protein
MSDQTEREARYSESVCAHHCRVPHETVKALVAVHGTEARAVIALADQEQADLTTRVRELEAALQQSRDDHQGAVEKLRAVEALADEGWHPQSVNTREDVVLTSHLRAALASPVESDAEDAK